VGATVVVETDFSQFVPKYLLPYICVDAEIRGKKVGSRLLERVIKDTKGDLCLHVDFENPAKRLYERVGFVPKYYEMRFDQSKFSESD
jgi:[ribosomal protein S18]-alanine N-acetyltransferase